MKVVYLMLLLTACASSKIVNTDDVLSKYVGQNIEAIYPKIGTPSRVVQLSDSTTVYIYEKNSLASNSTYSYYKPSGVATSNLDGTVNNSSTSSFVAGSSSTLSEQSQKIEFFVDRNGIIKSYHYSGIPKQVKAKS